MVVPLQPRRAKVKRAAAVPVKPRSPGAAASSSFQLAFAGAFLTFVGVAAFAGRLPVAVAVTYGAASTLAFLVYAHDKSAAQHGEWRTRESSLHLLGLVGGWPGAL